MVEGVEIRRPCLAHAILVLGSCALIVDVVDPQGDGVGRRIDTHDAVDR